MSEIRAAGVRLSRGCAEVIMVMKDPAASAVLAAFEAALRVPVEGDHGFRWKMIAQSGGT
jgi:hypothetical protein